MSQREASGKVGMGETFFICRRPLDYLGHEYAEIFINICGMNKRSHFLKVKIGTYDLIKDML